MLLCVFTLGKGQQAQSPVLVLQQVVSSGQLLRLSHGTSCTCAPCLGIEGIFSNQGLENVSSSQV